MTEERFWELSEDGARLLVIAMQWVLIWPFALLGLLASAIPSRRADDAEGGSAGTEGSATAKLGRPNSNEAPQ